MAKKIKVELTEYDRDILLEITDQLLYPSHEEAVTKAKKYGDYYRLYFDDHGDLEEFVNNLCAIINHEDRKSARFIDDFDEVIDMLENYL